MEKFRGLENYFCNNCCCCYYFWRLVVKNEPESEINVAYSAENAVLIVCESDGIGVFNNIMVNKNAVSDKTYRRCKEGGIKLLINSIFN